MIRKLSRWFVIISIGIIVSGCWDKVELENRGFVNAIGVDRHKDADKRALGATEKNRFSISVILPDMESLSGQSDQEAKGQNIRTTESETLSTAMKIMDSASRQKLYFGQTKVAILGKDLLSDENLLREALDTFERNREINRKVIVLSSEGRAEDILKGNTEGDPLIGMFVENFYKNSKDSQAVVFKQDLQSLISDLRIDGNALIPKITIEEKELKLGGVAVLKNYSVVGWLDDRETRGYMILEGKGKGAQFTAEYKNAFIDLNVNSQRSSLTFSTDEEGLICHAKIDLKGTIEGFQLGNSQALDRAAIDQLTLEYENIITKEVKETLERFQIKYQVDAMGIGEKMRKKEFDIYQQVEKNWETAYRNMKFTVETELQVTNTGSTI